MSRIVAFENVTLDGVMQAPAYADEDRRGGFEHGGWATPYADEAAGRAASVTELGAPLICARFPRAFVDANRAPGELDPAMFDAPLNAVGPRSPRVAAGLGVIPRVVRDGLEIYGTRLPAGEAVFRLEHFYRPYHAALAALVEQTRAEFGVAVVIDCHSMPPPAKAHDIVLGDCYGEAAAPELIGQTQRILSGLGFSVARNAPYAGGYTTHLYGRPHECVHAIQVEVSRALYLDETLMEKSAGFASCRDRLRMFAAKLLPEAGAVSKLLAARRADALPKRKKGPSRRTAQV